MQRALLVALGLALGATPSALAQQPDTTGPSVTTLKKLSMEELLNVEVTSVSRRPEALSRAASPIQVITQEDIRRSGASSVPEALRLATNLEVAQVDSRQWAISARGFMSTTANKLLVMIDGRTVYTPLYSGVFWDVQDVHLSDVDHIEVISGPGATLWGSNAVNGVINIITKHTAKDSSKALVSGGGGSMLDGFGAARFGGALGAKGHYRLYAKGFTRGPTDSVSGADAGDDWHFEQGGFRSDWDLSETSSFTVQGDYYDGRMSQASSPNTSVSGGNLTAAWSRGSLAAHVYFDHTDRLIPGLFKEGLETYDADFQHELHFGSHDVVWGLGYRLIDDHVTNSAQLAFLPPHVTRDWYTGFVQDEITLVPALRVVLGSKLEHNDYTGFEIQPSGRLAWEPGAADMLWTAVSRAVRAPSRIDRELFAPAQPPYFLAGGPNFHSEEELAYEVGYRHQGRTFALSLSTFYSHYKGLRSLEQVNPPNPTPIVIANGQDGESYGAEATGSYVAERWRVRAGYTELRVHIWPVPGSTDRSHGSTESHDPEHQLTIAASADATRALRLDGVFRYVAEIVNQDVPAYAELDARLTWRPLPKLSLSVVGQNLLHVRHAEFGAGTARREIPRGVYGSVEWRF